MARGGWAWLCYVPTGPPAAVASEGWGWVLLVSGLGPSNKGCTGGSAVAASPPISCTHRQTHVTTGMGLSGREKLVGSGFLMCQVFSSYLPV